MEQFWAKKNKNIIRNQTVRIKFSGGAKEYNKKRHYNLQNATYTVKKK
jgi:hypothetical protein